MSYIQRYIRKSPSFPEMVVRVVPCWPCPGLRGLGGRRLTPGSKLPDPIIWSATQLQQLIKSPKEAINVFDFEPVMRQNVPPAHFGYMASGIDDEVTLRANREGFLKFQLRPRRLVDVSKVDMSTEILGVKYDTPIIVAPVGGQKAFHAEGEIATARGARTGNHLQILSTATTSSPEEVTEARGAPIWYQLYATNKFDVAKAFVTRAERAGCPVVAVTVDRYGGRNQETLFRLRSTDTRQCSDCHDRSSLQANLKRRAMYQGVDISGLTNTQSSTMSWDYIKRMRDVTKMKMVLKGILAHEDAVLAVKAGMDGDHRFEPRRAQRGQRPLDHRRAARDHRSGEGPDAGPRRQRLPPRHRHREGAVHGRAGRVRRPALYLGSRRVRPARGGARAGALAYRAARRSCSRSALPRSSISCRRWCGGPENRSRLTRTGFKKSNPRHSREG